MDVTGGNSILYKYNNLNQVTGTTYKFNGVTKSSTYTYKIGGIPDLTTYPNGASKTRQLNGQAQVDETVLTTTGTIPNQWKETCISFLTQDGLLSHKKYKQLCREIIRDFDNLPITNEKKARVGIVGEILVKFLPTANNHLVDLLEAEGAEAVVPDLTDFLLYCCFNQNFKTDYLGDSKKAKRINNFMIRFFEWLRKDARDELKKSKHFEPTAYISDLAKAASEIVSIGNQTGEGWFLTGEMIELIEQDVPNIVCTQPFACLPNHIVGKGVIKTLRQKYPTSNIVAIDYDPGASEVNQLNRLKLMLSTAQKNLTN